MKKESEYQCNNCGETIVVYLSEKGNIFFDYCKCEEEWWDNYSEPALPEEAFLPDPNDGAKAIAAYEKLLKDRPDWNDPTPEECYMTHDEYNKPPVDLIDD